MHCIGLFLFLYNIVCGFFLSLKNYFDFFSCRVLAAFVVVVVGVVVVVAVVVVVVVAVVVIVVVIVVLMPNFIRSSFVEKQLRTRRSSNDKKISSNRLD